MKTLQVRLPENVHGRIKRLSREEGISLNQFIVTNTRSDDWHNLIGHPHQMRDGK